MEPVIIFDHYELGKGGALPQLRIDDFVNLRSLENALRGVSVVLRLWESFSLVSWARTTQGKSASSDLGLLIGPSFSPGAAARFDPMGASSAVSERSDGLGLGFLGNKGADIAITRHRNLV